MEKTMSLRAIITGTGSSAPERIITNQDLEKIVDTTDEWITRRTGISECRVGRADMDDDTSDLAARASLAALEMANMRPENVDMIVMGTVTADRPFTA